MDLNTLKTYKSICDNNNINFFLYKEKTGNDIVIHLNIGTDDKDNNFINQNSLISKTKRIKLSEFEKVPLGVEVYTNINNLESFLVECLWFGAYKECNSILEDNSIRLDISKIVNYKNEVYKNGFTDNEIIPYSKKKNFRHIIENINEIHLISYFKNIDNIDDYFSIIKSFDSSMHMGFIKCLIDKKFIHKIDKTNREIFYNHLFEIFSYKEDMPFVSIIPELKYLDDKRKIKNLFNQDREKNIFDLVLKIDDFQAYFLLKNKNVRSDYIRKSLSFICKSIENNVSLFDNITSFSFLEYQSNFKCYVTTKDKSDDFDVKLLNFIINSVYDIVINSNIVSTSDEDEFFSGSSSKKIEINKNFVNKLVEVFSINFNLTSKNETINKKYKI